MNALCCRIVRPLALCSLMLVVSACSLLPEEVPDLGPTLTDLEPARLPDVERPIPEVKLAEVSDSYRRALEVTTDAVTRRQIKIRLADLEMTRAEEAMLATDQPGIYFTDAIALYRALIDGAPEDVSSDDAIQSRDQLLYQLAKAHALDGENVASEEVLTTLVADHPQSDFVAEARFRQAERAFSDSNYRLAAKNYHAVLSAGEETPYYLNAVYMLAWSQFKQQRYSQSLESFTRVLDKLAGQDGDLGGLSKAKASMVADAFRVMSVTFSYLDGANSITETYQTLGNRLWQHELYSHLGDLYLEKKRFRDSADTFLHFVAQFPYSDHAPDFSVRTIKVYDIGGFPSLLLPAKQDFVSRYGLYSDYWDNKAQEVRTTLEPHLHEYLIELSSYEHAGAQELKIVADKNAKKSKAADKALAETQRRESRDRFLKAAALYQEFIDTFPQDTQTPELAFLLAESLYEGQQFARAYNAYEKVAYEYPQTHSVPAERSAEAGYSAILTAEKLIATLTQKHQRDNWQQLKTHSALRFAEQFKADTRAPTVLVQASQELLAYGELDSAISAATKLTQWQPEAEKPLRYNAWLVIAQAQFDSQRFLQAEEGYAQVLKLLAKKDPVRVSIVERQAASVFKYSEQQLGLGNKRLAVQQLLRIQQLSPNSDIAITAQYDAANYLIDLAEWAQAEKVILDYRTRFPKNALISTLPAKLVVVYQAQEKWAPAARELSVIAKADSSPEIRRQSLYLAAELYEKAGDFSTAILRYREYAHAYEQPFDQVMEARFKLSQLYLATKQADKRRFWLRKMQAGDANANAARTDRSRYLGAFSSADLADDEFTKFAKISLKLPLKKSLKKKKKALNRTLKAFERVLDYGLAEFTTRASYQLGEIYGQLSRDLMKSQRPSGLDELALEQYEILLEEQAFPFEEKAIEIHEVNVQRSWQGVYDQWVRSSFTALKALLPGRYKKSETSLEVARAIH